MFKKFLCLCLLIGAFAVFNELPSASALPKDDEDKEPNSIEEPADEEVGEEDEEPEAPAEEDSEEDLPLDEESDEAESESPLSCE
ncbi:PREDICTED: histone chaperone ASF1-like [Bactrocera latifrons]|uniref:histone chaperone ASF1-like n=1 Tax=Bactrocera latifrons TaxID=174628 RepID=UPI0008DD3310|nr:PREDICTED: histone chaperone ASF1-like [Bactrocera latifrons]